MPNKHKNKAHTKPQTPRIYKEFVSCVSAVKKSVFMIARGRARAHDPNIMDWRCIGSGFLAAPGRLVTAAHVIVDPNATDTFAVHHDNDKYYFLHRDDQDNFWWCATSFVMDSTVHLDAIIDTGVFYLPDSFYGQDGQRFGDPKRHLRIGLSFREIGHDIGVLGYPIANLQFENGDMTRPKIGDVILRADRGVVNARFHMADEVQYYNFTMAFNPGNSGGPIFDARTGEVVSIVKGFTQIDVNVIEKEVPPGVVTKGYSEPTFIDTTKATYSVGVASPSFTDFLRAHGIK